MGNGVQLPWTFKEINELYSQTKINLAFAQKDYLNGRIKRRVNLRVFEICMSGNFQLLQYTPCVEEYFEIDEEVVCWKNKSDLFNKILYYLENEDEREKIARSGHKRAIENHTWSKRFEKIEIFLNKKQAKRNITNFVINTESILKENKISKDKKSGLNSFGKKFIIKTLKKLGYNAIWDIKNKKLIKIQLKDKLIYYKTNLKKISLY